MEFVYRMTCYSPLHAYEGEASENGKLATVWRRSDSPEQVKRILPCGKCIGCKLTYSKGWAIRCMHEAQMHHASSFITLTFDDSKLPVDFDGSLDVRHVQLFMKRLRKYLKNCRVRYFFAGEYGGRMGRPHYHGLIFGYGFPDREFLKNGPSGLPIYVSSSLAELWPFGFNSVQDVTMASAAYVARYCVKKVTGEDADEHYVDKSSGVLRKPEFTVMSRRPGIGTLWFDRFYSDVFPSDEVVFNGRRNRPPRFYENLLDKRDPDLLQSLKLERRSKVNLKDCTDARLLSREEVKKAQVKLLRRTL